MGHFPHAGQTPRSIVSAHRGFRSTLLEYRFAHAVQQRSQTQQASTEELREATLRYRSLFDELLRPEDDNAAGTIADPAHLASSNGGRRVTAGPDGQVAEVSPNGRVNDPEAGESDSLADPEALPDPEAMDTDYRDQQIGR